MSVKRVPLLPLLPLLAALAALLGLGAAPLGAQTYPVKAVKLVVPFAAGGGNDVFARVIGQKLAEQWKQAVVVENRPGAGGNIGADFVAKATPDGYSLLLGHTGTLAINPGLYAKLPYDAVKDFAPIAQFATAPLVLVTGAPAGTPEAMLRDTQAQISRAVASADVRERLIAEGTDPLFASGAAFAAVLQAETRKWGTVIKSAGVRAD